MTDDATKHNSNQPWWTKYYSRHADFYAGAMADPIIEAAGLTRHPKIGGM
ncbi:MAG: hypothetical protein ACYDA9_04810 [Terriglobia bacterium]